MRLHTIRTQKRCFVDFLGVETISSLRVYHTEFAENTFRARRVWQNTEDADRQSDESGAPRERCVATLRALYGDKIG
jgi:hypothetical protein